MRIENSFDVPASPDVAWALLIDVPTVIPCMPGATIERAVDDSTWEVSQVVKLGPISLRFWSEVRRGELDEARRHAVLDVKSKETRGRGGADATIECALEPVEVGTRVSVVTELQLRGTVAQYGRPVVGSVARDMTSRFATCLASLLERESTAASPPHAQRL